MSKVLMTFLLIINSSLVYSSTGAISGITMEIPEGIASSSTLAMEPYQAEKYSNEKTGLRLTSDCREQRNKKIELTGAICGAIGFFAMMQTTPDHVFDLGIWVVGFGIGGLIGSVSAAVFLPNCNKKSSLEIDHSAN